MIGEANSERLYCRLVADAEMQDLNESSTVLNYIANWWQMLECMSYVSAQRC